MIKISKVWAPVRVKPNQISRAEINLNKQGFKFFSPKIKISVKVGKSYVYKEKLLFPSYIFVYLDKFSCDVRKIKSTFGLVGLIMTSKNKFGTVPDEYIDELRSEINLGVSNSRENLKINDKIEILSGPFSGLVGKLERLDGHQRIRCLFEIMKSTLPVSLDSKDAVKVV